MHAHHPAMHVSCMHACMHAWLFLCPCHARAASLSWGAVRGSGRGMLHLAARLPPQWPPLAWPPPPPAPAAPVCAARARSLSNTPPSADPLLLQRPVSTPHCCTRAASQGRLQGEQQGPGKARTLVRGRGTRRRAVRLLCTSSDRKYSMRSRTIEPWGLPEQSGAANPGVSGSRLRRHKPAAQAGRFAGMLGEGARVAGVGSSRLHGERSRGACTAERRESAHLQP